MIFLKDFKEFTTVFSHSGYFFDSKSGNPVILKVTQIITKATDRVLFSAS